MRLVFVSSIGLLAGCIHADIPSPEQQRETFIVDRVDEPPPDDRFDKRFAIIGPDAAGMYYSCFEMAKEDGDELFGTEPSPTGYARVMCERVEPMDYAPCLLGPSQGGHMPWKCLYPPGALYAIPREDSPPPPRKQGI